MHNRGGVTFGTDGQARDRAGIIASGPPVSCEGIGPNSSGDDWAERGWSDCRRRQRERRPGQRAVGDTDAVVVIPQARLTVVYARLQAVRATDARIEDTGRSDAFMANGARCLIEQAMIIDKRPAH